MNIQSPVLYSVILFVDFKPLLFLFIECFHFDLSCPGDLAIILSVINLMFVRPLTSLSNPIVIVVWRDLIEYP